MYFFFLFLFLFLFHQTFMLFFVLLPIFCLTRLVAVPGGMALALSEFASFSFLGSAGRAGESGTSNSGGSH